MTEDTLPPDPSTLSRRAVLASVAALTLAACAAPAPDSPGSSTPATPTPSGGTGDAASPDPSTPSSASSPTPSASTPAVGGPAREVAHGPRTAPVVALTFHGAGDPAIADEVLAAAEAAKARVTVLAVGTWLKQYPQVAARILRGGHELGNHTLHHRPMRLMDEATAYAEILGGQRLVTEAHAGPSWFRPSGTPHATRNILAAAGRAGYRTSLSFDVDPADYTDPGTAAVVSRVLGQVRAGSIVSLHLGHSGTVAAMPKILAGLHGRGLTAVTVSSLLPGVAP